MRQGRGGEGRGGGGGGGGGGGEGGGGGGGGGEGEVCVKEQCEEISKIWKRRLKLNSNIRNKIKKVCQVTCQVMCPSLHVQQNDKIRTSLHCLCIPVQEGAKGSHARGVTDYAEGDIGEEMKEGR